jgi:DNA-binding NtrC family response regulator
MPKKKVKSKIGASPSGRERPYKRVLLIEDEKRCVDIVAEGLSGSQLFNFQVEKARGTPEYLNRKLNQHAFDVAIIDLALGSMTWGGLTGALVVANQARLNFGTTIIVYSCHARTETVVDVMRRGANYFISKDDVIAGDVTEEIEKIIQEEEKLVAQRQDLALFLRQHGRELNKKYGGKLVAVVKNKVVVAAASRLEVLLEYADKCESHPEWPKEPAIAEIGSENEE